jgi:SH3 domain/BAR domain
MLQDMQATVTRDVAEPLRDHVDSYEGVKGAVDKRKRKLTDVDAYRRKVEHVIKKHGENSDAHKKKEQKFGEAFSIFEDLDVDISNTMDGYDEGRYNILCAQIQTLISSQCNFFARGAEELLPLLEPLVQQMEPDAGKPGLDDFTVMLEQLAARTSSKTGDSTSETSRNDRAAAAAYLSNSPANLLTLSREQRYTYSPSSSPRRQASPAVPGYDAVSSTTAAATTTSDSKFNTTATSDADALPHRPGAGNRLSITSTSSAPTRQRPFGCEFEQHHIAFAPDAGVLDFQATPDMLKQHSRYDQLVRAQSVLFQPASRSASVLSMHSSTTSDPTQSVSSQSTYDADHIRHSSHASLSQEVIAHARRQSVVQDTSLLAFQPAPPLHMRQSTVFVTAMYDYAPQAERVDADLALKAGDIIQVLTQHDSGWWVGELNGHTGYFPATYCCDREGPLYDDDAVDAAAADGANDKTRH